MVAILPTFVGIPGGPELLIVLFIAILLFGADKLPKLARSSGQAMGEFRKGRDEIESEIKRGATEATATQESEPSDGDTSATIASPVASRTDD